MDGMVVEQGMWRVRTNQELKDLHKDLDRVANTGKKRLEWIGHLVRMDHGRAVKISDSKVERRRRRGRPRLGWMEENEKDPRETKFKNGDTKQ
jgi:hypothetical protein